MQKIIIYKDKITLNQWESDKNDWVENDIKTLDKLKNLFLKVALIIINFELLRKSNIHSNFLTF